MEGEFAVYYEEYFAELKDKMANEHEMVWNEEKKRFEKYEEL